jgi:hypothetical protein
MISEERQRVSKLLEAFVDSYPLKHPDIAQFYKANLGSGPNSFIPTMDFYIGYHYVVYTLLLFLDQYGEKDLYINYLRVNTKDCLASLSFAPPSDGSPIHKTTLRDHLLKVVEKMVQEYRKSSHEIGSDFWPNHELLNGGVAALSYKIALARGEDYCRQYDNNLCQASLAMLEEMPAISSLDDFKKIKEIITGYHLFVNEPRFFADKKFQTGSVYGIVRVLIDAEQQVKRGKIFETVATLGSAGEISKRIETEAAIIIKSAETERIQSDHFNRTELKGLLNMQKLKDINKLQDKIINALENKDRSSVEQLKGKLEKLKNDAPVPESPNAELQNLEKSSPDHDDGENATKDSRPQASNNLSPIRTCMATPRN